MNSVLLIGAAGYIGKALNKKLGSLDFEVDVQTREGGVRSAAGGKASRDVECTHAMYDAVVDLAAYEPAIFQRRFNYWHPRTENYIMVSSAGVYPANQGALLSEEDFRLDRLGIARNKSMCETMLFQKNYRGCTVVRFPMVVGRDDPTGRLLWFFTRVMDGGGIIIPERYRDIWFQLVSLESAVDVITAAVVGRLCNTAYNWCDSEAFTAAALIKKMCRRSQRKTDIIFASENEISDSIRGYYFPVEDGNRVMNVDRLRAIYQPAASDIDSVIDDMANAVANEEDKIRRLAELTAITRLKQNGKKTWWV